MKEYEERFAAVVGAEHALAFSYARVGLRAVLRALGAQLGDEIILSPLTCKVVPLALLSLELKLVYADISADTLNLDPSAVERAISPRSRAILFQHTYGSSTGIDQVAAVAVRRGIPLIEDCAQCLPDPDATRGPGTRGIAAVFSNNLRKPLPAGSGGVVVMNDGALARAVQVEREQLPLRGAVSNLAMRAEAMAHKHLLTPGTYWHLFALKQRLARYYKAKPLAEEIVAEVSDVAFQVSHHQVAAGLKWLDSLPDLVAHRRRHVRSYAEALSEMSSLSVPTVDERAPLYYFPVHSGKKETILEAARKRRVELIAWPIEYPIFPVEREEELASYGYQVGSCPFAEEVARTLIGIPMDRKNRDSHRGDVLALFRSFAGT